MNRPFVWVALALLAGTWGAAEGLCPGVVFPVALFITACALALLSGTYHALRPVSVAVSFFAVGALLWNLHHLGPAGDPLGRYVAEHPDTSLVLEGRVRRPALFLPDITYATFLLDVDRALSGDEVLPVRGRVAVRWTSPDGPVFADDRIRVRGPLSVTLGRVNHGVQDVEDYFRRHGAHSAVRIRGPGAVERVAPGRWWSPTHLASRIRTAQGRRLMAVMPESVLPFALTVWLGDRSRISQKEYQAYIASGTAHILAVSGVHVGVVFISASFLLRLLLVRDRRVRTVLTIGIVFMFALMAGARVSVVRAAVMIAIYLLAGLFDREDDVATALSLSAILFILGNPENLFDRGFQLSFASVASILIFGERIAGGPERLRRLLREGLSTTLAVQILPFPLAIHFFHVLPAMAPLANLLVVPLLTISLWLCFMTAVCALLSSHVALVFGHALAPVVTAIHGIVQGVSTTPGTYWHLVSPTRLAMVLYWVAAGLLLLALSANERRRLWIGGVAVALALTALCWRPFRTEGEVQFLDVGHGDATFIRSPGGTTVLVDAGDRNAYVDMGARVVAPVLWSNHVSQLDYLVVTHPDRDHIGGVSYILEHFPVGEVVLGPIETDHPLEHALIRQCATRAVPVRRVREGDVILLDGASLQVLHPPADWPRGGKINDQGVVLRLDWSGVNVLLPADIEAAAEAAVAAEDCAATVLKAPHHGSKTSSTLSFIQSVQPQYCVISTGGYRGREPVGRHVLGRYEAYGIEPWRTDILGGIRLRVVEGRVALESAREKRGYLVAASRGRRAP